MNDIPYCWYGDTMTRVHYVIEGICTKEVEKYLKLLSCSSRSVTSRSVPSAGLLIPKDGRTASTGRRNFSRNSLGFLGLKQPSFLKFPRSTDYLTSQELVEFLFSRRRHVFTLQFVFLKSFSVCSQVTSDLYFALVIYKLDSCKNTNRTLVKVLLNWILPIFYTCSVTPVITSRTVVTWTCSDFY